MTSTRGFTLIELVVVMALSATLLSMVVVRWDFGSTRQQTISAARKLGSTIQTYRAKAQYEDAVYALTVDPANEQYALWRCTERSLSRDSVEVAREKLGSNVAMRLMQGSSSAVWFFDSRGVTQPGSIEMRDRDGFIVRLSISPLMNEIDYATP